MTNVILFGASGFLGRQLVKESGSLNGELTCPDSKTVNLCDSELVSDYLAKKATKSTTVIMIANHVPYASSSKDSFEVMFDNLLMVKNLLLALERTPVAEVIFASSVDVYGVCDSVIDESTVLNPLTNYAASKVACEILLKVRLTQLSIPFLNFRLPQIIGEYDPSPKVVNRFLGAAANEMPIVVTGDGSSSRDFVSVSDVAEIILRSVGQRINTAINLVSGNALTMLGLVDIIKGLSPEVDISFVSGSSKETRFQFDSGKFKRYFPGFVFENRADVLKQIYDYKRERL
jgi:nucleoside-diphosphate-sugar epimerase